MSAVVAVLGYLNSLMSPDPLGLRARRVDGERGAILVEYTLLIALIVLMCLAAVTQFGTKVPSASFGSVANSI